MKTVVFDFDGVIHSYKSGWQGENIIPDPPIDGIKKAIKEIRAAGYEVIVVSSRCAYYEGKVAIFEWLRKYGIVVDDVCKEKPPAVCYVDDRAICFDGDAESLPEKIQNFKPWYDRAGKGQNGRIDMEKILEEIDGYIRLYNTPPTGCEVEGTVELLAQCKDIINKLSREKQH